MQAIGAAQLGDGDGRRRREEDDRLSGLLERVADGDTDAFGQLYDGLASLVYGVSRRVVGDPTIAEDVTQEVFVELWRHAARFTADRGSVRGWVAMLARRRGIDRIRREEGERRRLARDENVISVQMDPPDELVVRSAERTWAREALAGLDPGQRDVLGLVYYDGLTHLETATHLGLPLGTVKTRIRAAVSRLRAAWVD